MIRLARAWHWLVVAAALAFALGRYAPALAAGYFSSDSIMSMTLFRDVFEHGGNPHHFMWGGKSDLFPDQVILLGLYRLAGDGLLTLQICTAIIVAGYLAAALWLYRAAGGRRLDAALAIASVFFVGVLANFGLQRYVTMNDMFLPNVHGGTKIMALAGLAILLRAPQSRRRRAWFVVLAAIGLLTTASDPLFAVIFAAPASAMLMAWRLARGSGAAPGPGWIANVAGSAVVGFFAGPYLWPSDISNTAYTSPSWPKIVAGLSGLRPILAPRNGGYFGALLFVSLAMIIVAAVMIVRSRSRRTLRQPSDQALALVCFCAALVVANFGAAILIGSFVAGLGVIRYVSFALIMPVIVLVGFLIDRIPWTRRSTQFLFVTSAVLMMLMMRPLPIRSGFLQEGDQLVPFLRDLMQKEHIDAGLADYWYANSMTFISHEQVRLRAVVPDGSIFHWVNNSDWYIRNEDGSPVEFGLILMHRLDPERIRQRFGSPTRVIAAPTGKEVWLYNGPRRITYWPAVGDLFSDRVGEAGNDGLRLTAASLPSQTGHTSGGDIVATPLDQAGFLTYGPYIHPRSGRYHIEISYGYQQKPAAGHELMYDAVLWTAGKANVLDHGSIPFVDAAEHVQTMDVDVVNPDRGAFEVRTFFPGSGAATIRSILIASRDRSLSR